MKLTNNLNLLAVLCTSLISTIACSAEEPHKKSDGKSITTEEALKKIKEGNLRYVAGTAEHPHQTAVRRTELATGQTPFAIVLGCADSRTAPEVIFDQGLGDLFVVRVAGNIVNDETLASMEYAVEHLGSKLIVVLGHERCGAVKAAKETVAANATAPGHIQSLVEAIKPAVIKTSDGDVEATAKANVKHVTKLIKETAPILKEKIESGAVSVVGAKYDLDTGVVEFFAESEEK
jgi:carbonic anhydrase